MTRPVSNASNWTTEFLDTMRRTTDPEADKLAADLFASGGEPALLGVKPFLDSWNAPIPADLPPAWREFFERPVEFPTWLDASKIRVAEDLFIAYGPLTVVTLVLNAVPHFFTNPTGARAFYLARIFGPESVRNRMHEVPRFAVNIAGRGGLAQGPPPLPAKGPGVISAQKLRMAHANIRIRLKLPKPDPRDDWDCGVLGEPINQEDLAQALMDFWFWTSHGLTKVGVKQTEAEQDAILHAWKVVGFLLGLREDMQPKDPAEARLLRDTSSGRNRRSTPEAVSLIAEMLGVARSLLPWWMGDFPAALMRYQLGGEVAAMLHVPQHRILDGALWLLRPVWAREDGIARIARALSPHLVAWLMRGRPGSGRPAFEPGFLLGR